MSDMAEAYLGQAVAGDRDHWSGPPEMVERILDLVRTGRNDVVLDVGAGLGGPAHRLADLTGCRVVALDALPDVLLHGRARYRERSRVPERVTFVAGSAESLPVRSESVDQVWSLGVVAHVTDRRRFAGEISRVLRPGGVLVLTESFWEGRDLPRFVHSAPQPWYPLQAPALARDLSAAGLKDIEVLPWPGEGIPGALDAGDPSLRADLADGRIVPLMMTARR